MFDTSKKSLHIGFCVEEIKPEYLEQKNNVLSKSFTDAIESKLDILEDDLMLLSHHHEYPFLSELETPYRWKQGLYEINVHAQSIPSIYSFTSKVKETLDSLGVKTKILKIANEVEILHLKYSETGEPIDSHYRLLV